MAQTRYNSFGRPLVSFDEDRRTIGLAIPGVYCGWDTLALTGAHGITLAHTQTGVKATKANNSAQDGPFGLVVSDHGVEVYEDDLIALTVAYNAANAFVRVDWVVMSHFYVASAGGSPATYAIIQGPDGINYGEPAGLTDPNTQVLIGKIYVPASAVDLSGIAWQRQPNPKLGGYGFNKFSETDIENASNGEAVIDNLNLITRTGVYHFPTTSLNPPIAGRRWNVLVLKKGVYVSQLATDVTSGKVYSRNSANTGSSWSPWVNLNNPDVVVDLSPITSQIGTRVYTEENYVTDGQTLTQSIDDLDMALKDLADDLTADETAINNLTSAIGNLTYSENNLLTDGESVTASLEKLDIKAKFIPTMYWKILNIGPWNMHSIVSVLVAHGVAGNAAKIRSVQVLITPDTSASNPDYVYDLTQGQAAISIPATEPGGWEISNNQIGLRVNVGGWFDSTDFDSTTSPANRGYILVGYVP